MLGGGSKMTYQEMVDQLASYMGTRARRINLFFLPTLLNLIGNAFELDTMNEDVAKRMNRDISFDNSPAIGDFNYHPEGFLEGNITI